VTDLQPRLVDWAPPALLDAPEGEPRLAAALLDAIDRQCELLAADVDRVWDDFFIESCADWAVPYIGSLVGLPADATRAEVAYAVALRRRKGTPPALEDFVRVVTGWTARAVEGWQVSVWTQQLGHPGPPRPASVDLRARTRHGGDSPFAPLLRSVTPGLRWSPRAATALVWPWQVRTYRRTRARALGGGRYALHPLGGDAPLYVRPPVRPLGARPQALGRPADEHDAPVRADYRVLEALAGPGGEIGYGTAWSVGEAHPLASPPGDTDPPLLSLWSGSDPIPWHKLRFGSVTAATPPPPADEVVVDLLRGHVLLGGDWGGGLRAVWHRPVMGAIGALAADPRADAAARIIVAVDPARPPAPRRVKTLKEAFTLAETLSAAFDPAESRPGRVDVEIRLETSERLVAPPHQGFTPRLPRWRIVAPTFSTPTVSGTLSLDLAGACLTLEGFVLAGDLTLGKTLAGVLLQGLTMSPGRTLYVGDGAWELAFEARRSILAPIRADFVAAPLRLVDCIVDGRGRRFAACGPPPAPGAPRAAVALDDRFPPALSADGCTFAGPVEVEAIDAVDCIFLDGLDAHEQQEGCLRNCYLGPGSGSLPTAYRCVTDPPPQFVSEAFEAVGYYALDLQRDQPLLSAASDGGEVGAHHHAGRARALARLRARAHEFVPLGLRAEVALAPWEEQ
jgi:hypothetical protein